jgi:hypothetical protein
VTPCFAIDKPEGRIMLFRKDIEPRCAYCQHGATLTEDQIMCPKKGIVSAGASCRRFSYDPLKRVPPRPATFDGGKFKKEDFTL